MDPVREALIVAITDYRDPKLQRLRAPVADATALGRVLDDASIGGFRVHLSLDEDESALTRRLARFFSDRRPDDLLLVHFSCHGIKDASGELYMAAADTETDLLSATGIPSRWLSEQIDKCRSKRIVVFLDCCFSGSFPFGTRYRAGEQVNVQQHLEGRGRVVITASNAMEYSFEGDQLSGSGQPSIFTASLVEGLETGAADRDGDRLVSVDELYDYVYDRVRETTPNQSPTKLSSLEGPLYIARCKHERPVEPAPLPQELFDLTHHPYSEARLGAVAELERLLTNRNRGIQLSARLTLESMVKDDSRKVSDRVQQVLLQHSPVSDEEAKPADRWEPPPTDIKPAAEHQPLAGKAAAPEQSHRQRPASDGAGGDVAVRRVAAPKSSGARVVAGAAEPIATAAEHAVTTPAGANAPAQRGGRVPTGAAGAGTRGASFVHPSNWLFGYLSSAGPRDGRRITKVGVGGVAACAVASVLAAILSWSVFKSAGYLGNGVAVAAFAISVVPLVIVLMAIAVWSRAAVWSPGLGATGILLGTAVPSVAGLLHYPAHARLFTIGVYAIAGIGLGFASTILWRGIPAIVVGISVGIIAGALAGAVTPLPLITHRGAWTGAQVLGAVISTAPLCVVIAMLPRAASPANRP